MMQWIPSFVALLLLTGCAAPTQTDEPAQDAYSYRQINMEEASHNKNIAFSLFTGVTHHCNTYSHV